MLKIAVAGSLAFASAIGAQSVGHQVTSADGTVQVIFPSRPEACGDGRTFIGHIFGEHAYYVGNSVLDGSNGWERTCVRGPARVAVTVISGEVTRIRPYVGPIPTSSDRTINVSAAEAAAWLTELIKSASPRIAGDAMLPLVLADGPAPWNTLLSVARDDSRPLSVRRNALTWVANGVSR